LFAGYHKQRYSHNSPFGDWIFDGFFESLAGQTTLDNAINNHTISPRLHQQYRRSSLPRTAPPRRRRFACRLARSRFWIAALIETIIISRPRGSERGVSVKSARCFSQDPPDNSISSSPNDSVPNRIFPKAGSRRFSTSVDVFCMPLTAIDDDSRRRSLPQKREHSRWREPPRHEHLQSESFVSAVATGLVTTFRSTPDAHQWRQVQRE